MAKQERNQLSNQRGQSVVEYILLLAVVVSLSYTFYSNPKFKQFFGADGFFSVMRDKIAFSYRYGYDSNTPADEFQYTSNRHHTYFNEESNASRFFSPTDPYGN